VHAKAILDWVESARTKIENSKNAPVGETETTEGTKANDFDSYYGEESDGGKEDIAVSIEAMQIFVTGMKQFEEFLISETKGAEEGDGDYYDEEEAGQDY